MRIMVRNEHWITSLPTAITRPILGICQYDQESVKKWSGGASLAEILIEELDLASRFDPSLEVHADMTNFNFHSPEC